MFDNLKKILGNPIFTFLFAIVLSLFFYWLAYTKQEISYSLSNEEVIAAQHSDSPDLAFSWKGKTVEKKVKRFKVAIWNSGEKYIDKSMFSSSYPLRVGFEKGEYEILGHNISTTSRGSLHARAEQVAGNSAVQISIEGDDGLEKNDGFILSIFYIGDNKPKINVSGRVKGINNNFIEVKWFEIQSIVSRERPTFIVIVTGLIVVGVLMLILSQQILFKNRIFKIVVYEVLAPTLGLSFIFFGLWLIFKFFKTAIYGLSWVL